MLAASLVGSPSRAAATTITPAGQTGPVTSVLQHGAAVGNSGSQNASAFADAVAAVAKLGGGTVDFSDLPLAFDGALRMPPNVSVRGGAIITFSPGAKWIYGTGHDSTTFQAKVEGIRFTRSLASTTASPFRRAPSSCSSRAAVTSRSADARSTAPRSRSPSRRRRACRTMRTR